MTAQSLTQINVNFNGTSLLLNIAEGKMMSLNDIYVAAGSPSFREPSRWIANEDVVRLIAELCNSHNTDRSNLVISKKGKSGGTLACKEIAKRYCDYLQDANDARPKGLYALKFSNGIIKVGTSIDVEKRVSTHEATTKAHGLFIIDRFLIQNTEVTENELLVFCRKLSLREGENHHGEYFIGIDFDKVKEFLGYKENTLGDMDCSRTCFDVATRVAALRS